MQTEVPIIDEICIRKYLTYLKEQECCSATLKKYAHNLHFEESLSRLIDFLTK